MGGLFGEVDGGVVGEGVSVPRHADSGSGVALEPKAEC